MRTPRAAASLAAAVLALASGCAPAAVPTPAVPTPSRTPAAASPAATPTATPSPTPTTPAELDLTVMTYNTLTGRNDCAGCRALKAAGHGDELALEVRMPKVAEKVELADPDIIGFQENEGPDELPQTHLAGLLDGYDWVEPEQPVPIAVRSDRFEVVDSGVEQIEQGARCTRGDRTEGRYIAWARLKESATGAQLWVFNTHLHPYDTRACAALRADNVAAMVDLVAGKNAGGELPQVIIGDFNAFDDERREEFSHHLRAMAEIGMADSRELATRDLSDVPQASSAGWMTAPVKGRSRIKVVRRDGRAVDYVWVPEGTLVRSWQVMSGPGIGHREISGVEVPHWTGVMASDHSPVVVDLQLPASRG